MDFDTTRWRQIDGIFGAALEKPREERTRFVARACGGDRALRDEVFYLLAADERAGGFLESSPEPLFAELEASAWIGRRLGPYRLSELIGAGGMGAVFKAERADGQFRQDVAVKLLRGTGLDAEQRLRLRAERQILARLQHPNIARLYDGGTMEDGRPYLVMELLDGEPIDRYCDRHGLEVAARLKLFCRVCDAVHHAHQQLLVHRDLKPSNVLVTESGVPKLLDFGIAKRLDEAAGEEIAATEPGVTPMTPRYASPEQVRGEPATTASDVYSLGVLLGELLTGRSPYQPAAPGRYHLERAICDQDPEPPSAWVTRPPVEASPARCRGLERPRQLARRLRGDLDAIVLKAMRKEPRERYVSAAQLAEDLERFRARQPVRARAGTARYRIGRFLVRHRLAATVAALIFSLGLLAAADHLRQARRVAHERDKAEEALAFLIDAFAQADPSRAGETISARQVLDRGAERIERELGGQPLVRASLLHAIGEAYSGLGEWDRAGTLLAESLALRLRLLGERHRDVASVRLSLGAVERERSDLEAAEALLQEAFDACREELGESHVETALVVAELGRLYAVRDEYDRAEALYEQALAVFRRSLPASHPEVVRTHIHRAELSFERGDYETAERLYRETLEAVRQAYGDVHPEVANGLGNLAAVYLRLGRYAESEELSRQALDMLRRILGEDHPWVLGALHNLAFAAHRQGHLEEAAKRYEEALALARRRLGERHPEIAGKLRNLSVVRVALGELDVAARHLEEALEVTLEAYGERHRDTAFSLCHLGNLRRRQGRLEVAGGLLERCLASMREVHGGDDHPDVAMPFLGLGRLAMDAGRPAEAEPFLRQAHENWRRTLPGHWRNGETAGALGLCLAARGRDEEAESLLLERHEIYARHFEAGDERLREAVAELAEFYRRRGRSGEAARWSDRLGGPAT